MYVHMATQQCSDGSKVFLGKMLGKGHTNNLFRVQTNIRLFSKYPYSGILGCLKLSQTKYNDTVVSLVFTTCKKWLYHTHVN